MISKRLKKLREEKGISQGQLGFYLKLSKMSISNYETDIAIRMAEYY